jgi:hypothetical protein
MAVPVQRSTLDALPVPVGFVVDKMEQRRGVLPLHRFSSLSIMLPTFHTISPPSTTTTTSQINMIIIEILRTYRLTTRLRSHIHYSSGICKYLDSARKFVVCMCVCVCVRARVSVCVCACVLRENAKTSHSKNCPSAVTLFIISTIC